MDYVGGFIDGYGSFGGRWTVRGVGSEERSADGVEGHGEDGEDEGDESPAGAEGGDHHSGPIAHEAQLPLLHHLSHHEWGRKGVGEDCNESVALEVVLRIVRSLTE